MWRRRLHTNTGLCWLCHMWCFEKFIGWNCCWIENVLDESVKIGWNRFWMKVYSTASDISWMRSSSTSPKLVAEDPVFGATRPIVGWWAARPQDQRVMELWLCSLRNYLLRQRLQSLCFAALSDPPAPHVLVLTPCLTQELPLHQLAKHLSSGAFRSFLRRSFRNTSKIACVKFRQQTTESQNLSHHTTTSSFFCLVASNNIHPAPTHNRQLNREETRCTNCRFVGHPFISTQRQLRLAGSLKF